MRGRRASRLRNAAHTPPLERSDRPVRQCAGCGRRARQRDLVRYAASAEGALVALPRGGGRGAYTCASRACFDRAVERRAFQRVLRRPVSVDPSLAPANYTDC